MSRLFERWLGGRSEDVLRNVRVLLFGTGVGADVVDVVAELERHQIENWGATYAAMAELPTGFASYVYRCWR